MTPYDPIESLREEVNRFHNTNAFDPLSVTLFYTQAKVVLSEMDRLKAENEKLKARCSAHQTPEPMRCSTCDEFHRWERANETTMSFPTQLHAIINDPEKEKAVLDLIQDECLREYGEWKEVAQKEDTKTEKMDTLIAASAMGASSNLLCRFLGLTKEE